MPATSGVLNTQLAVLGLQHQLRNDGLNAQYDRTGIRQMFLQTDRPVHGLGRRILRQHIQMVNGLAYMSGRKPDVTNARDCFSLANYGNVIFPPVTDEVRRLHALLCVNGALMRLDLREPDTPPPGPSAFYYAHAAISLFRTLYNRRYDRWFATALLVAAYTAESASVDATATSAAETRRMYARRSLVMLRGLDLPRLVTFNRYLLGDGDGLVTYRRWGRTQTRPAFFARADLYHYNEP